MGGCGSAGTERVVVGGSRVCMEWDSSFMLGHDGNLGWASGSVGNGRCGVRDEGHGEGVEKLGSERRGGGREWNTSVEKDGTRVVCCVGLACCVGVGVGRSGHFGFVFGDLMAS